MFKLKRLINVLCVLTIILCLHPIDSSISGDCDTKGSALTPTSTGNNNYNENWVTCPDMGPVELATGESATYTDSDGSQLIFTMTDDSENCGYKKLSEMEGFNLNCDMIVRNSNTGHWELIEEDSCGWYANPDYLCTVTHELEKWYVFHWCNSNTDWKDTEPCGIGPCYFPIPGWAQCGYCPDIGDLCPNIFSTSRIEHYEWGCN